jgi:hypothetical protein
MTSSFTVTKIVDGGRETTIKVDITGDAKSELTGSVIYDTSAYTNIGFSKHLRKVQYCLNGFSGQLYWGSSSTPLPLITLEPSHYSEADFKEIGYLSNSGVTDYNGDILLTTTGLTTSLTGYIILFIESKNAMPGIP